jgi:hypothetical protein
MSTCKGCCVNVPHGGYSNSQTLVVISTYCISSCKSNWHPIKTTTVPYDLMYNHVTYNTKRSTIGNPEKLDKFCQKNEIIYTFNIWTTSRSGDGIALYHGTSNQFCWATASVKSSALPLFGAIFWARAVLHDITFPSFQVLVLKRVFP